MSLAVICFTRFGYEKMIELSEKLKGIDIIKSCKGSCFGEEGLREDVSSWAGDNFKNGRDMLFIGAAGIAVRSIAPFIKDKLTDSAVIVMDDNGSFVIPLLSGHVGGANKLAKRIAGVMGAQAVITTSTDIHDRFAVDVFAKENHLFIKNRSGIAKVSSKVLDNESITIVCGNETDLKDYEGYSKKDVSFVRYTDYGDDTADVFIGTCKPSGLSVSLELIPRDVVIGAGCKRGKSPAEFEAFLDRILFENGIILQRVRAIATIDIKKDESCIKEYARKYNIEIVTFSADELNLADGEFTGSGYVKNITGTDNVCERAAYCCAKGEGSFIIRKTAYDGMTAALFKIED